MLRRSLPPNSVAPRAILATYRSTIVSEQQSPVELQLVPVLLHLTPVASYVTSTWFTAVQTSDGWIVVQI